MNRIYSNKDLAAGLILLFIGDSVLSAMSAIKTHTKGYNSP